MSKTIQIINTVPAGIKSFNKKFSRQIKTFLRNAGEFGKEQTQARAPRDTGKMEDSVSFKSDNKEEVTVFIPNSVQKNGLPYPITVHENWQGLAKSQARAKASRKTARTGKRVGERFMLRGFTEEVPNIMKIAQKDLDIHE